MRDNKIPKILFHMTEKEREMLDGRISSTGTSKKKNLVALGIPVIIFEQVASIRYVWRGKCYEDTQNIDKTITSISKYLGRKRKLD